MILRCKSKERARALNALCHQKHLSEFAEVRETPLRDRLSEFMQKQLEFFIVIFTIGCVIPNQLEITVVFTM